MPQLSKKNFVKSKPKKFKSFKSPLGNTRSQIEKWSSFSISTLDNGISISEVSTNGELLCKNRECKDPIGNIDDDSLTPNLFDDDDVDIALTQIENELDSSLGPDPGIPLSQELLNKKEVKDAYMNHCREFLKDERLSLINKCISKESITKYRVVANKEKKIKPEVEQKKRVVKNEKRIKKKVGKKQVIASECSINEPEIEIKIKNKAEKKKKTSINASNSEPQNEKEIKKMGKQVISKSFSKVSRKVFPKNTTKQKKKARKQISKFFSNESTKGKKQTVSLEEKIAVLQEARNTGLYALCDSCDKARYLPDVTDPLDLSDKWYCKMNPDTKHNKCSDPEEIEEEEEFLIDNLFNAGSIVWARMEGYPWWPAMVDDDPDLEQYFWLEEGVTAPTQYHVTFFDRREVTRAWLLVENIHPFKVNMSNHKFTHIFPKFHQYTSRINYAIKEAQHALDLPLLERLKKYCFVNRYSKKKQTPKLQKKRTHTIMCEVTETKSKKPKGSDDQKKRVKNRKFSRIISFMASDGINDNLSIATDELNLSILEDFTN